MLSVLFGNKRIKVQSTPVISKPDITKYPLIAKCDISPRVQMLLFSSAYNEYTVISKEYAGVLDFDITGVYCIYYNQCFQRELYKVP